MAEGIFQVQIELSQSIEIYTGRLFNLIEQSI